MHLLLVCVRVKQDEIESVVYSLCVAGDSPLRSYQMVVTLPGAGQDEPHSNILILTPATL